MTDDFTGRRGPMIRLVTLFPHAGDEVVRLCEAYDSGSPTAVNVAVDNLIKAMDHFANDMFSNGQDCVRGAVRPKCPECGADAITICTKDCDNDE